MARKLLSVDDLCRIIMANGELGPTLWVVTYIGERGRCFIREAGNPRSGEQGYDTSLLRKVDK